ncbi:zinc-binding dehydrogenase [Geodermatophilus sp. URMC 62]|uniref:zinc-binding dehydrogenase n=1 Tax=Geodermatophilus sp. URMC 62 TaxID=3423414 RepID=UPI00406CE095
MREATGGSVDVVVDPVFGTASTAAVRVLADGGRLVDLGSASGDEATFSSAVLRSRSAEVLGYTDDAPSPDRRRAALDAVLGSAAAGWIGVAHRTLPPAEVAGAWRQQASGEAGVRLVLVP